MRNFLLLALLAFCGRLAASPAPAFDVTDSDGNQHDLYGDYISQGKCVVIEIFFVNCPPCATHAPYLQTLYQGKKTLYPGKVEFFLMTTMSNDHDTQVAGYKTAKSLTMPAISSDGGSLAAIAPYQSGDFGPFLGTPTFIVIAPNTGEVFFDIRGGSPQSTMGKLSQLIDHLVVPAGPSNICGTASPTGVPIDSVRYTVETPTWDSTFWSGDYNLWNFPALQNTLPYNISAYKNDHPLDGVSTFDLVLLSKHILGITPFDAGWKTTAADVNLSGTVTAFDIVETRKLLLGIYDTFPFCTSWRFFPAVGTEVNGYCYIFQCIKMGDVNGSYSGFGADNAAERTGHTLELRAGDQLLEAGQTVQIDFLPGESADLQGLQLAFGLDPSAVEVVALSSDALPGFGPSDYNLNRQNEGLLPLSWIGEGRSARLQPGTPLLRLTLRVKQTARLSDILRISALALSPEAYDERDEKRPLELRWLPPAGQISIQPNPAQGEFNITLNAAETDNKLIQLYDDQGRMIFSDTWLLHPGINRMNIQTGAFATGPCWLVIDGQPAGKVLLQ